MTPSLFPAAGSTFLVHREPMSLVPISGVHMGLWPGDVDWVAATAVLAVAWPDMGGPARSAEVGPAVQ